VVNANCSICNQNILNINSAIFIPQFKIYICNTEHNNIIFGKPGRSVSDKIDKLRRDHRSKYKLHILSLIYTLFQENSLEMKNWKKGKYGEVLIGNKLNKLGLKHKIAVFHDLSLPGSNANIDHLLIIGNSVFIVDSKNYSGKVKILNNKKNTQVQTQLYIGNNEQKRLVEQALYIGNIAKMNFERFGLYPNIINFLCFNNWKEGVFEGNIEVNNIKIIGQNLKYLKRYLKKNKENIKPSNKLIAITLKLFPVKTKF